MNRLCATVIAAVLAGGAYASDIWKQNQKVLGCSPTILTATDTLVLTLGPKHGRELAIRRHSDGVWFFLVVGDAPPDMKSLMSRDDFSKARRISFKTTETGYAWVKGRGNERVFTVPGKYSVHVSDALESERGGHSCTVTYAP